MTRMTDARLREIIAAYGADPARWPADERGDAEMLLRQSFDARGALVEAASLDALLAHDPTPAPPSFDAASLAAMVTATPQPGALRRSAAVEGDIVLPVSQFLFRWFNVAGLATAMLAGFIIGWSGIDGSLGASAEAQDLVSGLLGMEYAAW